MTALKIISKSCLTLGLLGRYSYRETWCLMDESINLLSSIINMTRRTMIMNSTRIDCWLSLSCVQLGDTSGIDIMFYEQLGQLVNQILVKLNICNNFQCRCKHIHTISRFNAYNRYEILNNCLLTKFILNTKILWFNYFTILN